MLMDNNNYDENVNTDDTAVIKVIGVGGAGNKQNGRFGYRRSRVCSNQYW